jgi:hypothetical protein
LAITTILREGLLLKTIFPYYKSYTLMNLSTAKYFNGYLQKMKYFSSGRMVVGQQFSYKFYRELVPECFNTGNQTLLVAIIS